MQTQNQVFAVEAIRLNTQTGEAEMAHVQCVETEDEIPVLFESWYETDQNLIPRVEKVWLQ